MAQISLEHVSVRFPLYQGSSRSLKKSLLSLGTAGRIAGDAANRIHVQALEDVTLYIEHGERIALIGANGAGKTTLLRVLAGIYEPTRGKLDVQGRIAPMFDINLGVEQELTGYDNILLRGLVLGMTKREISERVSDIEDFTELGGYLHMPIKTYSAGMMLRLTFGISTCIDPEILLMDEWLMAGDAKFMNKAQARIARFVERSSILVLASHSHELLRQWCTRAILLERGQIQAVGGVDEILMAYHAR